MGLLTEYEPLLIQAVTTWLNAHKNITDRIQAVRPYLVQLQTVLNEVLNAVPAAK